MMTNGIDVIIEPEQPSYRGSSAVTLAGAAIAVSLVFGPEHVAQHFPDIKEVVEYAHCLRGLGGLTGLATVIYNIVNSCNQHDMDSEYSIMPEP